MNDLETRTPGALSSTKKDSPSYGPAALTPAVDVVEDGSGITLYADLPGVSKEKLQIQTESDTLTLEAELDIPVPEGLQSTHTEVALGRFRRTFKLSKELDPSKVTAKLVRGVLSLRIPKAEHAQPRRIQVDG
ncbi:Hsp20/alpha crystallin family protein [Variovorax sp. GT1P44]|uniref:Hsp20/alpha crystallin family protein n=1 Tax=Variovorax sp. GT1P44 TaxID=3443742 RepID=UPI003F47E91E